MADKKLNWKEKIKEGIPLNEMESTQAEADFNHKRRLREQEEKEAFEATKRGERAYDVDEDFKQETKSEEKKGK